LQPLYDFIEITNVLPIDDAIIDQTIALRQTKNIDLGDAIIGATAIVHSLTLITRNTSDFKNMEGIKVINPYDI
jgi:toxin FitB